MSSLQPELSPQMRRSISMPVKPEHLETETLKRSAEKETVFATTDEELSSDDGEDNSTDRLNYLRELQEKQLIIPAATFAAMTANNDNICSTDNDEKSTTAATTTTKATATELSNSAATSRKHSRLIPFRSVRDFFNPIFTLFRKTATTTTTKANIPTTILPAATLTTTTTPLNYVDSFNERNHDQRNNKTAAATLTSNSPPKIFHISSSRSLDDHQMKNSTSGHLKKIGYEELISSAVDVATTTTTSQRITTTTQRITTTNITNNHQQENCHERVTFTLN